MDLTTPRNQKILSLDELKALREKHPTEKLVHCHGVFDVLHAGHLAYFESAKQFGDKLVVTLTADKFVHKGPNRPYFNSSVRATMLAALQVVDYVAVADHPSAVEAIDCLRPHFYVKGPDYKDKARDVTGAIYDEEKAVKRGGGKLTFTEDETFSSSTLINKYFAPWTEDQQHTIEVVLAAGGLPVIEEVLRKIGQMTVSVVGEPIVDTYVFCAPEAISSKSPSISAKFHSEENYAGGSLAIANHLASFTKEVKLFFTHGGEPYFKKILKERMAKGVRLFDIGLANIPTPRKTRFIENYKSQRMFELTDLSSDQWIYHSPQEFCDLLSRETKGADVTLVADFGHGLLEGPVLETLQHHEGFIGLNVQTNSSNFGFNPFTKHRRFSFLNIDTREVRIAYHDRFTSPLELARRTQHRLANVGASFAMTMGPNGAYYFPGTTDVYYHSPAYADNVVDATGAGDAFFALTTLLVKAGCPEVMVPFIGNVFAGLKTKIIGNKTSVTSAELMKSITSILK